MQVILLELNKFDLLNSFRIYVYLFITDPCRTYLQKVIEAGKHFTWLNNFGFKC